MSSNHGSWKKIIAFILTACLLMQSGLLTALAQTDSSDFSIQNLKTEYTANPIGIDVVKPVFGWNMASTERGQSQISYRIMVASSIEKLAQNDADVWDSTKTDSDLSVGIEYGGPSLASTTRYHWKVQVWNAQGIMNESTEEAYFETGFMNQSEWEAKWIGAEDYALDDSITKFTIDYDFTIETMASGLVFGAKDSANFYMWQVSYNYGAPVLRPHKWTNGSPAMIASGSGVDVSSVITTANRFQKHHMKIVIDDGEIATYIDGVLVDTRTVTPFSLGSIGFRASETERCLYDNIIIKDDSTENVVYNNTFSAPADNHFGGGSIVSGQFRAYQVLLFHQVEEIKIPEEAITQFSVEMDFRLINDCAGIIFGAKNSANFYMWQINTYKQAGRIFFRPHVWTGGNGASIAEIDVTALLPGINLAQMNHIKIDVDNGKITTFINNIQVDQRTVAVFEAGSIGFRQFYGDQEKEKAAFDNVVLRQTGGEVLFSDDFSNTENLNFDGGRIENGQLVFDQNSTVLAFQKTADIGAPALRKEFNVDNAVKQARLYITARGLYEAYINGQKVGNDFLNPGYTEYRERLMYQTFDVTQMIKQGNNAVGAYLGMGWFAGRTFESRATYGDQPSLLAQLIITYANGTTKTIKTDNSWKFSKAGPITSNDLFDGETYDATRELTGWHTVGYDDSGWDQAYSTPKYIGSLEAQTGPTVQIIEEKPALELTEPVPKTYIYNIGQNLAGVAKIKVTGKAGTRIQIRYGEMLNKDGTLYTANLRSAKSTDYYTLKGDPDGEIYHAIFTFHGFQYIEITGLDSAPAKEDVSAVVISNATPSTGYYESSNALVNKLFSNTIWGQRSNFVSIPTDCPQRDERAGWMGDAQVFARTASYNMDVNQFFHKWTADVRDSSYSNGAYPDFAPHASGNGGNGSSSAGWGDAGVIVPWQIYQQYGDTTILRDNYDAMLKYIRYMEGINKTNLVRGQGSFGDWLAIGSSTDSNVIGTAYFAYSTGLVMKSAIALGKTEDAEQLTDLYNRIKQTFQDQFVSSDGRVKSESQTAYDLALYFGLVPESLVKQAAYHLVQNVKNNGWKLSTGFLGVSYLTPVLSENGYNDAAYRLLEQQEYPSWLYSVVNGATTIWERWNSFVAETYTFGDVGMNSFNHYSYGSIVEWMYRYSAGIERDDQYPGFKHFTLQPSPGGTLTYAKANYETPYGIIKSGWKEVSEKSFAYEATVPANTTATLYLPTRLSSTVMENGRPAGEIAGVTLVGVQNGKSVYELASGEYSFTYEKEATYTFAIENPQGIDASVTIDGETYALPYEFSAGAGQTAVSVTSNDPNYAFAYWTGSIASNYNPLSLDLDSNKIIKANFKYIGAVGKENPTLSIGKAGEGTAIVNGQEVALPYTGQFTKGEEVFIETKPAADYQSLNLTGDISQSSPAVVVMNGNVSVNANFKDVKKIENLALHAPVKANSDFFIAGSWANSYLTDGVTIGSGYTSEIYASVDASENSPWAQVDLGMDRLIDKVILYPRTDSAALAANQHFFPQDYTFSVSSDGKDFKVVKEVTGHPDTGSPVTETFSDVTARYVRVTATKLSTKTMGESVRLQFAEMEVYNSVNEKLIFVEGIALTEPHDNHVIRTIGDSLTITAGITPQTAFNTAVRWTIHDVVDDRYTTMSDKAEAVISGNSATITGVKPGVVELIARSTDGGGIIGVYRVEIAPKSQIKIEAVGEDGKPITAVNTNEALTMKVTTPDDATYLRLINENDLVMGRNIIEVIDNGDGTKTWTLTMVIATAGQDRTLSVWTAGLDKEYTDTGAKMTIDVIAPEPGIVSAVKDTAGPVTVNEEFTVTIVTSKTIDKIKLANESGSSIGIISKNVVIQGNNKIWTVTIKIGTQGERTIKAFGAPKDGIYLDTFASFDVTVVKPVK